MIIKKDIKDKEDKITLKETIIIYSLIILMGILVWWYNSLTEEYIVTCRVNYYVNDNPVYEDYYMYAQYDNNVSLSIHHPQNDFNDSITLENGIFNYTGIKDNKLYKYSILKNKLEISNVAEKDEIKVDFYNCEKRYMREFE